MSIKTIAFPKLPVPSGGGMLIQKLEHRWRASSSTKEWRRGDIQFDVWFQWPGGSGRPDGKWQMKRNTKQIAIGFLAVAFIVAAFLRGQFLLGTGPGVVYGSTAVALVGLLWRRTSRTGFVVVLIGTLLVSFALAFPGAINSDLRYFVQDHAHTRTIHNAFHDVFVSDKAFSELSVTSEKRKATSFTIYGTVPSRSDLERLRERLKIAC